MKSCIGAQSDLCRGQSIWVLCRSHSCLQISTASCCQSQPDGNAQTPLHDSAAVAWCCIPKAYPPNIQLEVQQKSCASLLIGVLSPHRSILVHQPCAVESPWQVLDMRWHSAHARGMIQRTMSSAMQVYLIFAANWEVVRVFQCPRSAVCSRTPGQTMAQAAEDTTTSMAAGPCHKCSPLVICTLFFLSSSS